MIHTTFQNFNSNSCLTVDIFLQVLSFLSIYNIFIEMMTVALQNEIHKDKTERQKTRQNFLKIFQVRQTYIEIEKLILLARQKINLRFPFVVVVFFFFFFYSFSSKDSREPGGTMKKYLIGNYKISQNNFLCHNKRFQRQVQKRALAYKKI